MKRIPFAVPSSILLATLCLAPDLIGQGAQQSIPSGTGSSISRAPSRLDSMDLPETSPTDLRRLEKTRQTERQRKMIADTNRLLALAAELKAATDKASPDVPPADLIKKAVEIEKLARSVKDRMKG